MVEMFSIFDTLIQWFESYLQMGSDVTKLDYARKELDRESIKQIGVFTTISDSIIYLINKKNKEICYNT